MLQCNSRSEELTDGGLDVSELIGLHCAGSTTDTTDDGLEDALYSEPDDKKADDCGRRIVLVLLLVEMVDDESPSLFTLPHNMEDDEDDDEADIVCNRSLFAEFGRVDEVKGTVPEQPEAYFDVFSLFTEFGRVRRP